MNGIPQIVKCDVTGECFQVEWWPEPSTHGAEGMEHGKQVVVLKGVRRSVEEQLDGFFENYTVVC